MSNIKKLMMSGAAGGDALDVDDVFSTYLYTGDATSSSSRSISNGIDLDGEGGLVWIKRRGASWEHSLYDSERSLVEHLSTNNANPSQSDSFDLSGDKMQSFNSDGFTVGNLLNSFYHGDYASWTFRKAPKFFDVVTYAGDSNSSRVISHNLGSAVGMIIIKTLNSNDSWNVFHRGLDNGLGTGRLFLDNTNSVDNNTLQFLSADSSSVTFANNAAGNYSGNDYVMYLFAHNDGDGEFGPNGDQDIIKCGVASYPTSGDVEVDLGFEPQWVLYKDAGHSQNWWLADTMRGWTAQVSPGATLSSQTGGNLQALFANAINSEVEYAYGGLTSTGFKLPSNSNYGDGNTNVIYIAIRRGPLAPPESATDVYTPLLGLTSASAPPQYQATHNIDAVLEQPRFGDSAYMVDRVRGSRYLKTADNGGELGNAQYTLDFQTGAFNKYSGQATWYVGQCLRRAPGFFDVVPYNGNGVASRTIGHSLGAVPEMIWVKRRDTGNMDWYVYHKDIDVNNDNQPWTDYVKLNTNAPVADGNVWADTAPTDSVFTVNNQSYMNQNNGLFITYLFTTLDGISKVGGYTGDGTNNRVINCGFSAGARFVLIRNATASGSRYVWDAARGIVSGNDSILWLNSTSSEDTTQDMVDTHNSGFTVSAGLYENEINASGTKYIFYAIA